MKVAEIKILRENISNNEGSKNGIICHGLEFLRAQSKGVVLALILPFFYSISSTVN